MVELKPCPFCGAKGKDLHIRRNIVVCFGCGAYGPDMKKGNKLP